MFKFDNKKQDTLTINVEGKEFTFNPRSVKVKNALQNFITRQESLNKKMSNENIEEEELQKVQLSSCNVCKDTINAVLGKRTYDIIFADRTIDFEEHHTFITYLFNKIKEYNEHTDTKVS